MIQPHAGEEAARLRIGMAPAQAQLHSWLSIRTSVWTYRQSSDSLDSPQPLVGPTIEVQQNQRVYVEWVNALTNPDGSFANHPVVAVRDLPAYVQFAERGDVQRWKIYWVSHWASMIIRRHRFRAGDVAA